MQTVNTPIAPARRVGRPVTERLRDEQGIALVIALLCMLLLTALGMALTMTTITEKRIAGNYRNGVETIYAADAGVERVMQDLLTVPDWNKILDGSTTSSFVDGAPGTRTLPDGSQMDLVQATAMVRCGKLTCTNADIDTATDERPWAKNNPRWQLYAYGPVSDLIPTATVNSNVYVVVWIGDDPSENDDNPFVDGNPPADPTKYATNTGKGVLSMLAYAYGPTGVRRVIEATVARTDTTEIERGYTGQRGQDEQNRRARKAAVQTPGKALTRTVLNVG
jgi:type IV pilus assembly PilX-like protein